MKMRPINRHHIGEIIQAPGRSVLENRTPFFHMRNGDIRYFPRGFSHGKALGSLKSTEKDMVHRMGFVMVSGRDIGIGRAPISKLADQYGGVSPEVAGEVKKHVQEEIRATKGEAALKDFDIDLVEL